MLYSAGLFIGGAAFGAVFLLGLQFALGARAFTQDADDRAETYEVGFAAGKTQGIVEGKRLAYAEIRAKRSAAGRKASETRKLRDTVIGG